MKKILILCILCILCIFSVSAFSGNGSGTPGDPYQITTLSELNETRLNLTANYILMNDINASPTETWMCQSDSGWCPIGFEDWSDGFKGTFDGQNYTISGLYMNLTNNGDGLGFIFYLNGNSVFKNVVFDDAYVFIDPNWGGGYGGVVSVWGDGLIDNVIVQNSYFSNNDSDTAGMFVGWGGGVTNGLITNSAIINCTMTAYYNAGGFVGEADNNITNSYIDNFDIIIAGTGGTNIGGVIGFGQADIIDVNVTDLTITGGGSGQWRIGGVAGNIQQDRLIKNVRVTDTIISSPNVDRVGGLVGGISSTTFGYSIVDSYANVSVTGDDGVGGLVGYSSDYVNINGSFAVGDVTGTTNVGGIIGTHVFGDVYNSYSSANVTATSGIAGGAFGSFNSAACLADKIYATGLVDGSTAGGLVASCTSCTSNVTNSYWDNQTTGQSSSQAGTSKSTADMQTQGTFTGWDFTDTWCLGTDLYPTLIGIGTCYTEPETPAPTGSSTSAASRGDYYYTDPEGNIYSKEQIEGGLPALAVVPTTKIPILDMILDFFKSLGWNSKQW